VIVNAIITGIIVISIGYMVGSIPSAYIVTVLARKRDIRQLGGGNVGGLNVFREVGVWPAVVVAIFDIGKGAAVVAIAFWLLNLSSFFVMLVGLAAVIGHNWMAWLKFKGGKGVGVTIGTLVMTMSMYGYYQDLIIFLGIIVVIIVITRNIALSMGTALLFLPLIVWIGTKSGIATLMVVILGLVMAIRYIPTAKASWAKAEGKKDFIFDRWKRNKG
jgi:glycerol-3-phosphate acyltransferase PlsY